MIRVEYDGAIYDVLKTLYVEHNGKAFDVFGVKFVLGNPETGQIVCAKVEDCKYIVDKKKKNLNE